MNNKSFTLIEILVVIIVIGIISSFIIVSLSSVSSSANIAKGQAFSNSLRNSLLMNLVSEQKLDGNANDSWGTNNGTWYGSEEGSNLTANWRPKSECISNQCLHFDGTDDFINIPDSTSLTLGNEITISIWVKLISIPDHTSNQHRIIDKFTYPNSGYYFYLYESNKCLYFNTYDGTAHQANNSQPLSIGNWYYIVATSDGTNNKVYLNSHQGTPATSGVLTNSTNNLRIAGYGGADFSLNGLIDDVHVYNQTIPTSQIQQNYFLGLNKLYKNRGIAENEYIERIAELKINLSQD